MKPSHLHLPGYDDVEDLALLFLFGDLHLIYVNLRNMIAEAASTLSEHDKSARQFVKKYESTSGDIHYSVGALGLTVRKQVLHKRPNLDG